MAVETCSPEDSYALGEEIASFAARVNVAMHAMLTRLRRFDAMNGWAPGGFISCAHWLAWRTHIEANTAREHVRVARALGELPLVDAHFARGELSYSKVRAITRVATPETEQAFIDIAEHSTASQIARLFRTYERCLEDPQAPREQRRHVHRSETIDGMIRIEIVLPPEEAVIVWEAMEAAMDTARRTPESPEHDAEQPPRKRPPSTRPSTRPSTLPRKRPTQHPCPPRRNHAPMPSSTSRGHTYSTARARWARPTSWSWSPPKIN